MNVLFQNSLVNSHQSLPFSACKIFLNFFPKTTHLSCSFQSFFPSKSTNFFCLEVATGFYVSFFLPQNSRPMCVCVCISTKLHFIPKVVQCLCDSTWLATLFSPSWSVIPLSSSLFSHTKTLITPRISLAAFYFLYIKSMLKFLLAFLPRGYRFPFPFPMCLCNIYTHTNRYTPFFLNFNPK